MKQIKHLWIAVLAAMLFTSASAVKAGDSYVVEQYKKGQFTVSPFVSYRFTDITKTDDIHGAGGAGLKAGYHLTDRFAMIGEARTEGSNHSLVDDLSAGGIYYVPIGNDGLALYGQGLVSRGLEKNERYRVAGEGGLELRGKKFFSGFAGLRYDYAIIQDTHSVMAVFGGGIRF